MPVAFSLDCDVVIVNYNAGALLSDCVASIFAEGVDRIIVVDNASADGSLDALERIDQAKPLLTVIRNQANLGFAKACNIGAEASSAGRILFLNPDCVLSIGALAKMISTVESSPRIGMVGGFLSNPDGSEQPGGRRVFPTPKRAFMRAFGLSRLAKFFPEAFSDFLLHKETLPTVPVVVEAISGACMLVKRAVVDQVGVWDEAYFLHCEDLDWCMRMRLAGWNILFVPSAKITHALGVCSKSRPFFVEWHKHRGMVRFYRKFFRHQYPGVVMWLVILGVWFRFGLVVCYHAAKRVLARLKG